MTAPSIRLAHEADLPAIVQIYNASIPTRMATADLEPVTVDSRRDWFREHRPGHFPLWIVEGARGAAGWASLSRFHVRAAYRATSEISVYVDPAEQRAGFGRALLAHAVREAPKVGLRTLIALVFGHNTPSLRLFEQQGFARWGELPRVAELDGVERDVVYLGLQLT